MLGLSTSTEKIKEPTEIVIRNLSCLTYVMTLKHTLSFIENKNTMGRLFLSKGNQKLVCDTGLVLSNR